MSDSPNAMITSMNHITLAVKDVEKAFTFYRDTIGIKPLVKWDRGAYFLVGDGSTEFWFCLNVDAKRVPNPCYTHYAFTVSAENFATMAQKIIDSRAYIFKDNTSPGESLYFLDPDGHKLEIHVGDWHSRITAKKATPGSWQNVEWFISDNIGLMKTADTIPTTASHNPKLSDLFGCLSKPDEPIFNCHNE